MPNDPYLVRKSPRDTVLSVARADHIADDVADDFVKVAGLESRHSHYTKNGKVKVSPVDPKDGQRAVGFAQIKPATARSVGVSNPYDESENVKAGLRYFAKGGNDPVRRRIAYFSGTDSKSVKYYDRTGKIPQGGDFTGTSFEQYVRGTGGQAQDDSYLVPKSTTPTAQGNPYLIPKASVSKANQPSSSSTLPTVKLMRRRQPEPTNSIYASAQQRAQTGRTAPSNEPFALLKSINEQPFPVDPDSALRSQAEDNARSFTIDPVANVKSAYGMLTKGRDAQVNAEVENELTNLKAQRARASTPEMIKARQEYGAMRPLPGQVNPRAVVQPLAKTGAGILKLVGGITSLAGLTENDFSKWANARGQFIEEAATLAPLNIAGEEIKRGLPEKAVGALEETGLSIAEIVLLKKATGMPLGRLLALETALKSSDEPLDKRAGKVAESYAMGKALEFHLSRPASALLFGGPTAARQGQSYLSDGVSLEDAILQTAVQSGVGLAMGGKPKGAENARPTETQRQGVQAEQPMASEVRQQLEVAGTSQASAGAGVRSVEGDVLANRGVIAEAGPRSVPGEIEQPQRFQHLQFGEVEVTADQSGARPGKLKVAELSDPGKIHYVKKADRQGRGNAQLLPIKPTAEQPLEVSQPSQNQVNQSQGLSTPPTEPRKGSVPLSREELNGLQDWTLDPQEAEPNESAADFVERNVKESLPATKAPDESNYVYHATFTDRVGDIADKGLLSGGKDGEHHWGGGLGDESAGNVFFAKSPEDAAYYPSIIARNQIGAGEHSVPDVVIMRVAKSALDPAQLKTVQDEFQFGSAIDPSLLEVYHHGEWKRLTDQPSSSKVASPATPTVENALAPETKSSVNATKTSRDEPLSPRVTGTAAIAAKEPWQMTSRDWHRDLAPGENTPNQSTIDHAKIVDDAMKSGKPVPREAFNDHPELREKYASRLPERGSVSSIPVEKGGTPKIASDKESGAEKLLSGEGVGESTKTEPTPSKIKLNPRQRERSFPETVRKAGYEAADSTYDVLPNVETVAKAKATIKEKGLDRAVADITSRKEGIEFTPEDVAIGVRAIQAHSEAGDIQKSVDVAELLAEKLQKAGQVVQSASLIARLSPEGTLLHAQRILPKGEKLDAKQGEMLIAKSKEVRTVENQLAAKDREMTIPQLRARIRELQGESPPKSRVKIEGFQARMMRMETEARARIAETKAKIERGELSFRNTGPVPGHISAHYKDYVTIGAAKIARGGVDFAQWSRQMVDEFGDAIRPHLNKIFLAAKDLSKEQRAKSKLEGQTRSTERILRDVPKTGEAGPYATPEAVRKEIANRLELQKKAQKANRELQQMYDHLSRTTVQKAAQGVTGFGRANLLTAAKTLIRNIPSNAAHMVSEGVSRPIAAMADMVAMRLKNTGVRTTTGLDFPAEVRTTYDAVLKEGPRRAADIILGREVLPLEGYGNQKETLGEKMQMGTSDTGIKLLDFYIDKVFAAQGAVDAPFKIYAFSRELADIAKSQAITERMKDKSINVTRRAKELRQNPTDAMLMEASAYADYATFQNDNTVSKGIRSVKRTVGTLPTFAIEQLAPFDRTPTNIIYRTFENSPLGFIAALNKFRNIGNIKGRELSGLPTARAKKGVADAIADAAFTRAEQKDFARTFGRASTGTILAALALTLAHKKLLSGSSDYNTDKGDYMKKRKEAGGGGMLRVPGTNQRIYIGDTPAGKSMATVAAMYEQFSDKDKSGDEKVTGAIQSVGSLAANQPLLQGTREMFSGKSIGESAGNYLTRFIPGSAALKQIGEVTDPEARKVYGEGFGAQIKAVSPYHRRGLPVNTGVNKGERGGPRRRLLRSLDPLNTTTEGKGPVSIKLKSRTSKGAAFKF